jgi:transposase-like protein
MPLTLTETQRTALKAAMAAETRVRRWKRDRAILLRGEGGTVEAVAQSLGCSQASVYAWSAAWRQDGVAGLAEGDHGGGKVKLGAAAEAMLTELLASDPRPMTIALPGGRCRCCARNWPPGAQSSASAPSAARCTGWDSAGNGHAIFSVVPIPTTRQKRGRHRGGRGDAGGRWGGLGGR